MAKYIDAEKLKAELRRQKHELELSIQSQGDYGQSCHIVAYENILSLIDSLQQEQPSLPSDLEEAAKEYANTTFKKPYSDNPDEEVTIIEPDKHAGFIAGAKWDREQMMKEAVKGEYDSYPAAIYLERPIPRTKNGDKVRIIIVKEDKK